MKLNYKVVIEPSEEGGYSAYIPALDGCISEGETVEETVKNITEAAELYIQELKNIQSEIKKDNTSIVEVVVTL